MNTLSPSQFAQTVQDQLSKYTSADQAVIRNELQLVREIKLVPTETEMVKWLEGYGPDDMVSIIKEALPDYSFTYIEL